LKEVIYIYKERRKGMSGGGLRGGLRGGFREIILQEK